MDSESFVTGGPTWMIFFLVDEGREDPSTTISRPSLACQRNTINWHFSGPTLNAGLVAVIFQELRSCIARNPYIFVIFQRGGSRPPVPLPLDPHMTKDKMGIVSTSTQKPLIGYIGTNHY